MSLQIIYVSAHHRDQFLKTLNYLSQLEINGPGVTINDTKMLCLDSTLCISVLFICCNLKESKKYKEIQLYSSRSSSNQTIR